VSRYSHQFLMAVTVCSEEEDFERIPFREKFGALMRRSEDIILHDRDEAFQLCDTEEV